MIKKTNLLICSLILAGSTLLGACTPTVANRGAQIDPDRLAEIQAGQSTREDVATKLGTPTMVSNFDDKIWYYVGRKTEQVSFLDPELLEQKGVRIKFDEQGKVIEITSLDPTKVQDVATVERATPTYGQDDSFLKQLFGTLSNARPGLKGSQREGGGNTN